MRADFEAGLRHGSAEFASSLDPPPASAVRARGDRRRRRRVLGSTALLLAVAAGVGGALADDGGHGTARHVAASSASPRPASSDGPLTLSLTTPDPGAVATADAKMAPVPVRLTVLNRGAARPEVSVEVTVTFPKGAIATGVSVRSISRFDATSGGRWTMVPLTPAKPPTGIAYDASGIYTTPLPVGTTFQYLEIYAFGHPFQVHLRLLDGTRVLGTAG